MSDPHAASKCFGSPAPAAVGASVARLNSLPMEEAIAVLLACCGSKRWAHSVAGERPFGTVAALHEASARVWWSLGREDWLEAFSHHPRIGERNLTQAKFVSNAAHAGREQSGMAAATDAQRAEFADLNAAYERRFGHVFLICATGKSATQMLDQLRIRLGNDAPAELTNAANEQSAITRLRLERWLST